MMNDDTVNYQEKTKSSFLLTPVSVAWYVAPDDVSTVSGQGPVFGSILSSKSGFRMLWLIKVEIIERCDRIESEGSFRSRHLLRYSYIN